MKVRLNRSWYTPRRQFFLAGVHTLPDSMKDILPSSAEILDEGPEPDPIEEREKPVEKKSAAKSATK